MANTDSAPLSQSESPLFLGIDLGTSGVRAIVIDTSGDIICQARSRYSEPVSNQPAKINPDNWWRAVVKVLQELRATSPQCIRSIAAIAVDGTSSTVLLSDEHGEPLTEALMYFDPRAEQQAMCIGKVAPEHHPATAPTSGLAKWLWLKEHTTLQGKYHLLHQADWIAGKLAGQFGFSDVNNALKSGYDPLQNSWPDWVKALVAQPAALPRVFPTAKAVCTISAGIAEEFGFKQDVLLVSGTTDSTAAVIATGANHVGDAVTSLGSTLVLKVICNKPVNDASVGIYSQPFGKFWLAGGASNSGGAVLRQYFNEQQMADYEQQLDVSQPTQLDYYPLPAEGERFPLNNPHMKSRTTPRPQSDVIFFQGLLEGIANIEYQGYKKLHAAGAPWPISIRTTGGGSQNQAWKTIRQNLLRLPMPEVQHAEAAYGSAILARRGWEEYRHTRA